MIAFIRRRPDVLALVLVCFVAAWLFAPHPQNDSTHASVPAFPAINSGEGNSGEGNSGEAPAGLIAYGADVNDKTCVHVVDASNGSDKTITCSKQDEYITEAWTNDGHLVVTNSLDESGSKARARIFDPNSGKQLDDFTVGSFDATYAVTRFGASAAYYDAWYKTRRETANSVDNNEVVTSVSEAPVPIKAKASDKYTFKFAYASPDNHWTAVVDSENRILIADNANGHIRTLVRTPGLANSLDESLQWYQPNHPEMTGTIDYFKKTDPKT